MKKTPGRSLNLGEWGRLLEEELANYQGDSFIVDALMESRGIPRDKAEVRIPSDADQRSELMAITIPN